MRARLLLRQVRPGRPARPVPGSYRGGASDRPAAGGPHPRRRGRYRRNPGSRSGEGGVTGVLHCFTGSADLARKALDLGFYISISGIVTFKNARTCRKPPKTSRSTGCWSRPIRPFLAPVPNRARRASRRSSRTPPPSCPTCATSRSTSWPRQRPPTSSSCSTKRRREGQDTRLRHVDRSAADRQ